MISSISVNVYFYINLSYIFPKYYSVKTILLLVYLSVNTATQVLLINLSIVL